MPTDVGELGALSASRGGMETTVVFKYDEPVAVVMSAFRERTRGPHPSMPLVRRVDILCERLQSSSESSEPSSSSEPNDGWGMRSRRFFVSNDAPDWVRKVGASMLTLKKWQKVQVTG